MRLTNVQHHPPDREDTFLKDPNNGYAPDQPRRLLCLPQDRTVEPCAGTLRRLDHRTQTLSRWPTRQALAFFEAEGDKRIKINPLAHFGSEDVAEYITNNRLPRHPLVAKGFASIGCAPCTTKVAEGEDPRAGRWRGSEKTECGIHFRERQSGAPRQGDFSMTIVTDTGFQNDDWTGTFTTPDQLPRTMRRLRWIWRRTPTPTMLRDHLANLPMIRVDFPSFADGRGFTIARRLRDMGYKGRLRARGHVIADQYAMARRSGFDEVEIDAASCRTPARGPMAGPRELDRPRLSEPPARVRRLFLTEIKD